RIGERLVAVGDSVVGERKPIAFARDHDDSVPSFTDADVALGRIVADGDRDLAARKPDTVTAAWHAAEQPLEVLDAERVVCHRGRTLQRLVSAVELTPTPSRTIS